MLSIKLLIIQTSEDKSLRNFITRELTKYQIAFSKTTKELSLKYRMVIKRKNPVERKDEEFKKKLIGTQKKCFDVSRS